MPARKRTCAEAELDASTFDGDAYEHNELIQRLRNTWEFASLMQYLCIFGRAVKVDEDFDMDVGYCRRRDNVTLADTDCRNSKTNAPRPHPLVAC